MARLGYRVGVVDTDLPSPGIHNLLRLDLAQSTCTLNHFLWGDCRVEAAAHEVSAALGLQAEGGLWLVPASIRAEDIARVLKEGYDVRRLNDGLRELATRLQLDFLFIDTHPGLSKETFLSIAIAHLTILVLRPDKQDFQGTAVTVDVARQLRVRKLLLAVNKAHRRVDGEALRSEVQQAYDAPVIGVFPLSEDVAQQASDGVFSILHPEHPISQRFVQVARELAEAA